MDILIEKYNALAFHRKLHFSVKIDFTMNDYATVWSSTVINIQKECRDTRCKVQHVQKKVKARVGQFGTV